MAPGSKATQEESAIIPPICSPFSPLKRKAPRQGGTAGPSLSCRCGRGKDLSQWSWQTVSQLSPQTVSRLSLSELPPCDAPVAAGSRPLLQHAAALSNQRSDSSAMAAAAGASTGRCAVQPSGTAPRPTSPTHTAAGRHAPLYTQATGLMFS